MSKTTLAAIFAAAAAFLFFILVLPEYNKVRQVKDALSARQMTLQERSSEYQTFKDLAGEYDKRQNEIAKILVFLPPNKQIDGLVSSFQQATVNTGLQLTDLGIADNSGGNDTTGYKKALANLNLIGSYPAVMNFLKTLEQSLRLYDVTEISAAQNSGSATSLNVNVKVNAYYLK